MTKGGQNDKMWAKRQNGVAEITFIGISVAEKPQLFCNKSKAALKLRATRSVVRLAPNLKGETFA